MRHSFLIFILLIIVSNLKGQAAQTTFGLQYKPIIPFEYFNSSYIKKIEGNYNFNLTPKYSHSFGMILRHKINKIFSTEYGLNYTQRNYTLSINNKIENINDFTSFGIRSYEVPIQFLTYVRASKYWYLNVAFGMSHNILASDILSYGDKNEMYFQNTYRKSGGYRALLANIGVDYRTENNGIYYLGASLHMPLTEIGRVYPEYNDFNNQNFEEKFFLDIPGSFITIDFRYFFKE